MSLKRFQGWEPATETTYEYDRDGRLARAVTSREVEWTSQERGWTLALLDMESDKCTGCGGVLSDTTDPDSEGVWDVPPPTRCHRCTAIAIAQERYTEAKQANALLWAAEKRE